MRISVALVFVGGMAIADGAHVTGITGYVGDPLGNPVEGATVVVTGADNVARAVATDRQGRYSIALSEVGSYRVDFAFGRSHHSRHADTTAGRMTVADGEVDTASSEVIVIHDPPPPPVPPRPKHPPRVLPYSDEAIEHDVWTRAWLLLDVSETGKVTRVKFLHRPGSNLDQIALDLAFATEFEPAKDAQGHPIRNRTVWGLEWPSFWWKVAGGAWTRCKGTGPLNLDAVHPVYRDCTPPDLTAASRDAWIERPRR